MTRKQFSRCSPLNATKSDWETDVAVDYQSKLKLKIPKWEPDLLNLMNKAKNGGKEGDLAASELFERACAHLKWNEPIPDALNDWLIEVVDKLNHIYRSDEQLTKGALFDRSSGKPMSLVTLDEDELSVLIWTVDRYLDRGFRLSHNKGLSLQYGAIRLTRDVMNHLYKDDYGRFDDNDVESILSEESLRQNLPSDISMLVKNEYEHFIDLGFQKGSSSGPDKPSAVQLAKRFFDSEMCPYSTDLSLAEIENSYVEQRRRRSYEQSDDFLRDKIGLSEDEIHNNK